MSDDCCRAVNTQSARFQSSHFEQRLDDCNKIFYLELQIGRTKPNFRADSMRLSLRPEPLTRLTVLTQTPAFRGAALGTGLARALST
jgi:hypothetical protein